jgi:hypothetical protein
MVVEMRKLQRKLLVVTMPVLSVEKPVETSWRRFRDQLLAAVSYTPTAVLRVDIGVEKS